MAGSLQMFKLACLLAAVVGLATADEPERILGGSMASKGEFPYNVAILSDGVHVCGGAIVSEYHVITAGHCVEVEQRMPYMLTVKSGYNRMSGGWYHDVKKVDVHPDYTERQYDIAVLTLAAPISFNEYQDKVNLPSSSPRVGAYTTVTGWGAQNNRLTSYPTILYKLNMRVVSKEDCESVVPRKLHRSLFCGYKATGQGTCHGDSGGPMVYNNELVGVISGGIPCALGYPDFFTDVFYVLPFIRKVMER